MSSMNDTESKKWAKQFVFSIEDKIKLLVEQRIQQITPVLEKVLEAFSKERLGVQHFASSTGYGHGDIGREAIDRIFANILGSEKAAVRLQFVSGTHAITSALFGILRPGDHLLSVTGSPYETLEEVIGIRGAGQGSLKDFGVNYKEIPLTNSGNIDIKLLDENLNTPKTMIFIQRSCGYTWREAISIEEIQKVCSFIHNKQPNCICFVDNCYGEFVQNIEPTEVGSDLIAGSLIKNLGGTIVPTGGYVAGKANLVEQSCCRLTSPGIGSKGGIGFDLNRQILQGLFLAPQMVGEALIGAELLAQSFQDLGYEVLPRPGAKRSDLIQIVSLKNLEVLKIVCRSFQKSSPVGSYIDPIPAPMPGYESDLIMAGGTFIDGSTSEFSADAPLKPPYNLFIQGGIHRSHIKIALIQAISDLIQAGFIKPYHND